MSANLRRPESRIVACSSGGARGGSVAMATWPSGGCHGGSMRPLYLNGAGNGSLLDFVTTPPPMLSTLSCPRGTAGEAS
jgi:hypothetical protein